MNLCHAGGKDHGPQVPKEHPDYIWSGPNYMKPHIPVDDKDGDRVRKSCMACGCWLED